MQEIKDWLEGSRDYQEGVDLLAKHHLNKILCRNLTRNGESETNHEILVYELSKLIGGFDEFAHKAKRATEAVKKLSESISQASESNSPAPEIKLDNLPKEIEEIILIQGKLFNKKAVLSNSLVDLPESATDADRKQIVDQIVTLTEEYNRLADLKTEWQKTGKIPEIEVKPKLDESTKVQLLQERNNLRSNLTKTRKNLEKYQAQPAKVVKYREKEAQITARLNEIEEKLK
jgi:cell fate (sporulation/competence/biofilm development) regulator YlbF (YheA/YmcA/DUF963 family)